jgi:alkyl hydroperoxide reductase subunit AhpC
VAAYKKFHDKGFDVFGVSFDKDHGKWVEAIDADGLTWTQVSDLKYWKSAAGKLYGIQSIPQNILLDPNGIIIAKNLRGEELQAKLSELLKK